MKIIITIENEQGERIGLATSNTIEGAVQELCRYENHPELLKEIIDF